MKIKIPETITVIVYSAKGLKPKKNNQCKYSVIFGVGKKKFKTDVVEDFHGSPIFNTDTEIPIVKGDVELFFKVQEKSSGETIGKVIVPLSELPSNEEQGLHTAPLRSTRKVSSGLGDLTFRAWVSFFKVVDEESKSVKSNDSWKKKSNLSLGISKIKDKFTMKRNDSNPNLHNNRISQLKQESLPYKKSFSNHDLPALSVALFPSNNNDFSTLSSASQSHSNRSSVNENLPPVNIKPEVTGISPKEGPIEGGTRITIRGTSLGVNKEDVVGLFVCGSNILSTLEYFSPSKLIVTTKPWRPGPGNITIETQSGGKGTSLVQFNFSEPKAFFDDASSISIATASSSKRSSVASDDIFEMRKDMREGEGNQESHKKKYFDSPFDKKKNLSENKSPEVTGVSPNEAPFNEVTMVTIRGSNLGKSKEDVLNVLVCGKDVVKSLEYESSSKIICSVGPVLKPTRGEIIVETESGGVGVCLVEFKMVDVKKSGIEKNSLFQRQQQKYSESKKEEEGTKEEEFQKDMEKKWSGASNKSEEEKVATRNTTFFENENSKDSPNEEGKFFNNNLTNEHKRKVSFDMKMFQDEENEKIESEKQTKTNDPENISNKPIFSSNSSSFSTPSSFSFSVFPTSSSSFSTNQTNQQLKTNQLPSNQNSQIQNKPFLPPIVEIRPIKRNEDEEKISRLEDEIKVKVKLIDDLNFENKNLADECQRLKLYMEHLVAKAMIACPSILSHDYKP